MAQVRAHAVLVEWACARTRVADIGAVSFPGTTVSTFPAEGRINIIPVCGRSGTVGVTDGSAPRKYAFKALSEEGSAQQQSRFELFQHCCGHRISNLGFPIYHYTS